MFVWRLSVIGGVFRLSCSLLISVVCIPVLPRPRCLLGLFRSPLSCNCPIPIIHKEPRLVFVVQWFWPPEVITSPTWYICYIYSYQYKMVTHALDYLSMLHYIFCVFSSLHYLKTLIERIKGIHLDGEIHPRIFQRSWQRVLKGSESWDMYVHILITWIYTYTAQSSEQIMKNKKLMQAQIQCS